MLFMHFNETDSAEHELLNAMLSLARCAVVHDFLKIITYARWLFSTCYVIMSFERYLATNGQLQY